MPDITGIEEYSAYTSLANTVIILILSLVSLKFTTKVLFIKTFRTNAQNLSPVITCYFVFLTFWCSAIVIESIYYLFMWQPYGFPHNGTLLYFFGIFPWFCLYVNPAVDLFLGFDRCLAVLFPLQHSIRTKYFITFVMVLSMPLLIVIGFDTKLLIVMCLEEAIADCKSFTCVILYHSNLYNMKLRFALTICNAFSGIILIILLKCYHKLQNAAIRNATKAVVVIVGFTMLCDVIPNIIAMLFVDFILLVIKYVGTFAATLNAVNLCFCSAYYCKTICKSFHKVQHTDKVANSLVQKF